VLQLLLNYFSGYLLSDIVVINRGIWRGIFAVLAVVSAGYLNFVWISFSVSAGGWYRVAWCYYSCSLGRRCFHHIEMISVVKLKKSFWSAAGCAGYCFASYAFLIQVGKYNNICFESVLNLFRCCSFWA
jgi:hypothetical protein